MPIPPADDLTHAADPIKTDFPLTRYEAACRALAEAVRVDEVKNVVDIAVAMACYARQAKNRDAEANAIELRMRATRRLDQMRQAQKATIGLAKGGGGKHGRKRVEEKPTLKSAGIDKNLANEGRKLGALSDDQFEQKVAEARDATASAISKVVNSITLPAEAKDTAASAAEIEITLKQRKAMSAAEQRECLKPENFPSDVKFNKQDSDGIDSAQNSWNLIVGCKHECPYCWARDVTKRFPDRYPHGFEPVASHAQRAAQYEGARRGHVRYPLQECLHGLDDRRIRALGTARVDRGGARGGAR
jgi:hypothetical protein